VNRRTVFGCCGCSAGLLLVVGVLAVVALAFSLAGPIGTLKPTETAVVVGPEHILAMDYDREAGIVYFVLHRGEGNVLVRRLLATGEQDVLHTQSSHTVSWVSLSRRGSVFVFDSGNNPFDLPWVNPTTPRQIVELRGTTVVGTITILSPTELSQRVTQADRTPESVAKGCEMAVADSEIQTPLGVDRVGRVLRLAGKKPSPGDDALVPRFLVLGSGTTPSFAVTAEDCGVDLFRRFAAQAVATNLSHLNESVLADTASSPGVLVADKTRAFTFRSVSKGLGYFNFPCEKYYDQVAWGGKRYNMGSCAQGIMGFPQSYDVFTPDGDFLYFRWRGIYRVGK
jgi:hypothetical protein